MSFHLYLQEYQKVQVVRNYYIQRMTTRILNRWR